VEVMTRTSCIYICQVLAIAFILGECVRHAKNIVGHGWRSDIDLKSIDADVKRINSHAPSLNADIKSIVRHS